MNSLSSISFGSMVYKPTVFMQCSYAFLVSSRGALLDAIQESRSSSVDERCEVVSSSATLLCLMALSR